MEGKRAAAATLYCMLIMLSGLQQVAGFLGFCGCFSDCYHGCREGHAHPEWFCTVKCVETCNTTVVSDEVHDTTYSATDCSEICFTSSICGVAQITDGKKLGACYRNLAFIVHTTSFALVDFFFFF